MEDGIAEVRQVSATEGPVPIAAVALAAVKLSAGLIDERLSAGAASAFSVAMKKGVRTLFRNTAVVRR